jgi:hypothetical protein
MEQQARHAPAQRGVEECLPPFLFLKAGIDEDAAAVEQQSFGPAQAFRIGALGPLRCVEALAVAGTRRGCGGEAGEFLANLVRPQDL